MPFIANKFIAKWYKINLYICMLLNSYDNITIEKRFTNFSQLNESIC